MKKINEHSLHSNKLTFAHDKNSPGGQDKERKEENKHHHPDEPRKPYQNPNQEPSKI